MRKINKQITDEAVIVGLKYQPEGGYGTCQEEKLALTRNVPASTLLICPGRKNWERVS